MKRIAISIGDLNGIGIHIALLAHNRIKTMIEPLYCIDEAMLKQAASRLNLSVPGDFTVIAPDAEPFAISPGNIDAASGAYAFASFRLAVELARQKQVHGICTLPIHKKAWEMAGVPYKGHTDALRHFFNKEAIMMLGCEEMYVALYTEHIPLKAVPKALNEAKLTRFLLDFYEQARPTRTVAVLGLNPHAGDGGVLGDEERIIARAVANANTDIEARLHPKCVPFEGPLVPDVAFTPHVRERYTHYVAMYHDQGLAPLKALYFEESINVSLNLPILRTSVDHGTAFDIAYKAGKVSTLSYINAVRYLSSALS
jgi:4-hydroxythreonine-4-phosphate dehydrogenase